MSEVLTWDTSAANNNSAPPDGAPENMNYSDVNNVIRENMAAIARHVKDTNGSLTTGGTADAITVTPNATYASYTNGMRIAFTAGLTNTGATTLKVGSLAAAELRGYDDVALSGGEIVAGRIYDAVYNGTRFNLVNPELALNFVPSTGGTFTGAVTVTGGLTVTGTSTLGAAVSTVGTFSNFKMRESAGGWAARWTLNNDNTLRLQTSANDFGVAANTPILIDSSGNVGIKNTSPGDALDVTGNIVASGRIRAKDGSTGDVGIGFGTDHNIGFIRPASDTLGMVTGSATRVTITPSGDVGIGTSSPDHKLSVFKDNNGNRTEIGIDNTDQRLVLGAYFESGVGQYSTIQSTNNAESSALALVLQPDGGNVGIGTTSPDSLLELAAATATTLTITNTDTTIAQDDGCFIDFRFEDSSGSGAGRAARIAAIAQDTFGVDVDLVFQTRDDADASANASERMRLTAEGRLGIGTTSPNAELEVDGAMRGGVYVSTEQSGTLTIASRNALVDMNGTVTVPASVFSEGDVIILYSSSASRSVNQGSGLTMHLDGTATTGNRTLAQRSMATIYFESATRCVISGGGVT